MVLQQQDFLTQQLQVLQQLAFNVLPLGPFLVLGKPVVTVRTVRKKVSKYTEPQTKYKVDQLVIILTLFWRQHMFVTVRDPNKNPTKTQQNPKSQSSPAAC